MSITATISPPALCLSRNQIPLRLSTPDAYTTAPLLGTYREVWSTGPTTVGNTILYEWVYNGVNYAVTYTFQAASDYANNEIIIFAGGGSTAFRDWIQASLIPGLLAHPDFNQFFAAELYASGGGDSGVKFYARDPYYADLDFNGTSTGFSISKTYTEGAAAVAAKNYAARILLSIAPNADSAEYQYIRLPEIQGYPNAAGQIDIDLQPMLEPYFRASDLPALPMAAEIKTLTSGARSIKIEYAQQSGDPLERGHFTGITTRVLQGGVNTHDWTTIRSTFATWISGKILTNRKIQRIYPTQPQYIHWYQRSVPAAGLELILQPITPSTRGPVFITAGDTPLRYRTHRVPVHPGLYGLANVKSYYAFMGTNDDALITPISEKIKFIVMPKPTGLTIIEYQNQWGYPETIALPWTRQRIAAIAKEGYERARPLNYALTDRARITLGEQLTDTFELSIPANDLIDGPHIPELLLSPDTYIIVDGTTRIPCTIEGGSINQELHSRRGQQWPNQAIKITLERQISWSRIINLTNLCP